jgi:hypothetical protein
MKLFRFFILTLSLLSISSGPIDPIVQGAPEIVAGPVIAQVGLNPISHAPSGWYTSDVTILVESPADALANGKPLKDGKLTITDEGRHEIELQPGPFGEANRVAQFVNIDKTAPKVTWLIEPNSAVSGYADLSAEITDAVSGICSIEDSLDNGQSWETQFISLSPSGENPTVYETTWSLHRDFSEYPKGVHLIQLRAHDCAGNVSPGEILVFRVEKP